LETAEIAFLNMMQDACYYGGLGINYSESYYGIKNLTVFILFSP